MIIFIVPLDYELSGICALRGLRDNLGVVNSD